METRDVMVFTVPGSFEPALAIAAERAGACGVLDLEFACEWGPIESAIHTFSRHTSANTVKLGLESTQFLTLLPSHVERVILSGNTPELVSVTHAARETHREVFIEVVSLSEAREAVKLAVDGIILKGHEAGGRVGQSTSYILLQQWCQLSEREGCSIPIWVRGGLGPHTAAACIAAGARGIVLDTQLLLARESPLSDQSRRRLSTFDGSETHTIGRRIGQQYRCYFRPDCTAISEISAVEDRLITEVADPVVRSQAWFKTVRERIAPDSSSGLWPIGQDAALAARLARQGVTVAGIVQHYVRVTNHLLTLPAGTTTITDGAPFAQSHGTRYPILQGPMTRVSDTAAFADAVSAAGGLPFLALALMRKNEADKLLADTRLALGNRPWGVGILGFVPNEIRSEQLVAIRTHKPPFAIIAGGRPDQARELESLGITTYLHVPSPGLLRMFLKEGARHFIFEGQECGGHIGPRSSFSLWQSMIDVIDDHLSDGKPGGELHLVFAGGIHDRLSAGMVGVMTAGLAEKGLKIGVLLGTAYLFTQEAVTAGAITERFQQIALGCNDTVLLETGPGHAIRCIPTPYAHTFEAAKQQLQAEGKSPLEVGLALERMNLGRLRVASKGVERAGGTGGNGTGLHALNDGEQYNRGMYMIGQVAALRDRVTTIAELHASIVAGLPPRTSELRVVSTELPPPPPCDIAIIGLSCFYPKAGSLWQYWENILAKKNAVIEIPASHWDWRPYYDPDPRAKDKMISKWGGFMDDIVFDPLKYGITPKSIPCIEPLQLLLLEAVHQALGDAGYLERPFERERTCAILGVGGGGMPLSVAYGFRSCMPLMDSIPGIPIKSSRIVELGEGILPEWTEDSFPGILLNVAAGRVANRFNLGGPNMAIDAACGSSLAALYAGVNELNSGRSDVAIVMGGDAVQTPYAYVAFSKTHALSPKGRCRPFDADADGIALAEGVGVAVLKRLSDAERDGDRIYAVIKGIGASSDGRDKGLTAPRAEGQLRALQRAYAQARISPSRVGLVEAHGTGTVVGDQTEARAIGQLFRDAGATPQSAAIGSVKSMIGHSKCAAGLAGLIKATFALHHKVLPPTLVETPNPRANLDGGPLYLNTEARPWIHGADYPRTAGVSAFGFGGTNFHAVLEEYTGDYLNRPTSGLRNWPAELFVWRRPERAAIIANLKQCRDALAGGAAPSLADMAASVWQSSRTHQGLPTLCIVASSLDDLKDKLDIALTTLTDRTDQFVDPRGIYFSEKPQHSAAKIAVVFPGQGSQYPEMLGQIAIAFTEVRSTFDEADHALGDELGKPLSRFVYPPAAFTPEQAAAQRHELQRTEVAQPALGAACLGMWRLLGSLGITADMFAGHSYGEYVALAASEVMSTDDLIHLSYRRGLVIKDAAASASGGMLAVFTDPKRVDTAIIGLDDVWIVNRNSPSQTIIAGTDSALTLAAERLTAAGFKMQRLPVSCGFHSPLIAASKEPLANAIAAVRLNSPRQPVYSNTTALPHSSDPQVLAQQLVEHLVAPVNFTAEIQAMYDAGARVFIEVGPQGVLTGLISQILDDQPHLAVATDHKSRPGLVQLAHALAQLLVAGIPVQIDRLYHGRDLTLFEMTQFDPKLGKVSPPPTAWVVNGVRSRPINGPEPRLLGQSRASDPTPPMPQTVVEPATATLVKPRPLTFSPSSAPQHPMQNHEKSTTQQNSHAPQVSINGQHQSAPKSAGATEVMLRFQDVMSRFLETQRSVMLNYLGSSDVPTSALQTQALVYKEQTASNGAASHTNTPRASASDLINANTATHNNATNGHLLPQISRPENPKPSVNTPATDRESLLTKLLDLVSERTGYPKDALSIDLDLEADLGIDSIKRVEILGTLAEGLGEAATGDAPKLEMEKLSTLKTLRSIADYVADAMSESSTVKSPPIPSPAQTSAQQLHPGARQGDIQRLVIRPIDAPLPLRPVFSPPAGTILITDDGRGTARELADRLAELDVNCVLVRRLNDEPDVPGVFSSNLDDVDAIAALIAQVHAAHGAISGLIHLLPLADPRDGELEIQRMRREVKGLYLLARGLETDLREAGREGNAVLLAVTAMGGTLGYGPHLPDGLFPGHGGIAGFTKCLAHEWPEVVVRVVDVDGETPAPRLAELLLSELGVKDGPCEVGRTEDHRIALQVEPGPLNTNGVPSIELNRDSTILITGGARGITAKVALELARRYQPRLVLIGSSPLPVAESARTRGLSSPAELKSALMNDLGPDSRPAIVETAYRRLLKDREILANLEAIRLAGSRVEYHAVDVRDDAAFGSLIEDLNTSGGITAVIHGAGVIEDKLLRDKTPESYDRVFDTKVCSAYTLVRKLDFSQLKFFALFASITSRYGNRGQSDYAAANDVLSKLACDLDRKWPGRVVSIAWGPWAEVGMVADLQKHLIARGLKLIPPELGAKIAVDEMVFGSKGEPEVLVAGGTEQPIQHSSRENTSLTTVVVE